MNDSGLWAFAEQPRQGPSPARAASSSWPQCGARTRSGRPCVAPGGGVGGRCPNHGGVPGLGAFVLQVGLDRFPGPGRHHWSCQVWSPKSWALAGGTDNSAPPDIKARAGKWPQVVGLRVARRLVERDRVTRVHLGTVRDARQLRTLLRAARVPDIQAWCAEHVACPDDLASSAVRKLMAETGAEDASTDEN